MSYSIHFEMKLNFPYIKILPLLLIPYIYNGIETCKTTIQFRNLWYNMNVCVLYYCILYSIVYLSHVLLYRLQDKY